MVIFDPLTLLQLLPQLLILHIEFIQLLIKLRKIFITRTFLDSLVLLLQLNSFQIGKMHHFHDLLIRLFTRSFFLKTDLMFDMRDIMHPHSILMVFLFVIEEEIIVLEAIHVFLTIIYNLMVRRLVGDLKK